MSATTKIRIGDAERDAAATSLGDHFAAGRLTRAEFDERLEQAWAAKTADELAPLFVDLPSAPGEVTVRRRSESAGLRPGRLVVDRGPVHRRPPFAPVLLALALFLIVVTSVPVVMVIIGFLLLSGVLRRGCAMSRSLHRGRAT